MSFKLFSGAICMLVAMALVVVTSCNKRQCADELDAAPTGNQPGAYAKKANSQPLPKVSYLFSSQCSGSFTISLIAPTIVKVHQDFVFSNTTPFQLETGYVEGYDDLTIPAFPDRFFGGTLRFAGQGNDSLFGTVTVQTSVFSDPVNPGAGDFTGSEDFTGTFEITGGTGRYLNATGLGSYTAHSEYVPTAGALLGGTTTLEATATVAVVPHIGNGN